MRKLLKLKNYDLHAITTRLGDKCNANIVAWVMQTSRDPVLLTIALEKSNFTHSIVEQTGKFVINLLSETQTPLIRRLGQVSGASKDKIRPLEVGYLPSGIPYFLKSVGYIECEVISSVESGDHRLYIARPINQKVLAENDIPLTYQRVRELGLIRG